MILIAFSDPWFSSVVFYEDEPFAINTWRYRPDDGILDMDHHRENESIIQTKKPHQLIEIKFESVLWAIECTHLFDWRWIFTTFIAITFLIVLIIDFLSDFMATSKAEVKCIPRPAIRHFCWFSFWIRRSLEAEIRLKW